MRKICLVRGEKPEEAGERKRDAHVRTRCGMRSEFHNLVDRFFSFFLLYFLTHVRCVRIFFFFFFSFFVKAFFIYLNDLKFRNTWRNETKIFEGVRGKSFANLFVNLVRNCSYL